MRRSATIVAVTAARGNPAVIHFLISRDSIALHDEQTTLPEQMRRYQQSSRDTRGRAKTPREETVTPSTALP